MRNKSGRGSNKRGPNKNNARRPGNPNWIKGGASPNPKGRKAKQKRRAHGDGYQNIATGLGVHGKDKRTAGALVLDVVPDATARDLWRGNDLAKRIIEDKPREALSRGIILTLEDKDAAEKMIAYLEDLPGPVHIGKGATKTMIMGRCYERAYGGGAVWPVVNDAAGGLDQPLDLTKTIPPIERLQIFEPRELRPGKLYTDLNHPKYGEPETWHVFPLAGSTDAIAEIHETRLIMFPGVRVTREQLTGTCSGWGDNALTPVMTVLNDFELSFGNAAALLQDFAQAVLKLDQLAEVLAADGQSEATQRLELMNYLRSSLRALVVDSKDSFERTTTSLAGYPDMLDRFMYRLAAAAEEPVTRLFGMSPGGLNATGESDESNWLSTVGRDREHVTPMWESLLRFVFMASDGPTQGKEPAVWSVDFPPLKQLSAKEDAEARLIQMQIDTGYIDKDVYSADETAEQRFGGDKFSFETRINFEERQSLAPSGDNGDGMMPIPADGTQPVVATDVPAANGLAGANGNVQTTAFNGAQVASMVDIVMKAATGELSRESAMAILSIAFPITAKQAEQMLGPKEFTPPPKQVPPAFGGAPAPAPIPDPAAVEGA